MESLSILGGIAGMFLLACMSPGPVWMVITSTAIAASRRAGVMVGLGVAGATLTWATVAILGLGVILSQLAWLSTAIRLAGAAYLVWIGARMIAGARRPAPTTAALAAASQDDRNAMRRGFLISITNPKAAVFFGSVFAVMLPAQAPVQIQVAAVMLLAVLSAAWHCGLAVVFSVAAVQAAYRRCRVRIDTAAGTVLILLGCRMAASR